MQHAIVVAPFEELSDPRAVVELGVAAEASGWDAVFVWDHVMRDEEETELIGSATVTMAALAARTERIRIGAMVTPITRRRPQVFARETIALDRLSNGRLVVGLGLGVDRGGELSRFGDIVDPIVRGRRLDEGARLLKALWSGETVDFHGEHFTADGVRFRPGPIQRPHPPLWFAARGDADRPVRRAALLGDGIDVIEMTPARVRRVAELVAELRGSLDGFDIACPVAPGADGDEWADTPVTWLMHSFGATASAAEVEHTILAGPPR